ncbi:MAG: hypothetical protein QM689_07185 [Oscillospiraceae bacterium]
MKKDGKYRFSLQFSSDSDAQVQAGELLERLANKKSAVVVSALTEYLDRHPELQNPDCKIQISVASGSLHQEKIEQMIRTIVEEKIAALQIDRTAVTSEGVADAVSMDDDVSRMLCNLALFE